MATAINDRIDVRISKEQKELIKYAAELSGFKSLSEFIVFHIQAEANKIIKDNNTIRQLAFFLAVKAYENNNITPALRLIVIPTCIWTTRFTL